MKDEEMAEEYCNEMMCTVCSNIICGYKGKCTEWETRKRTFLAGLKAGRPQWHDLMKDPHDLPKKNKSYWVYIDCQGNKIYRSIVWLGCWLGCWDGVLLAWCEEPTFDKE